MINKKLVFTVLCLTSTCVYAVPTEKKFADITSAYKDKTDIADVTITDDATTDFFSGKKLKNITFKGKVTGDWKNVSFDGTVMFTVLPEGSIDKEISATFALADGAALKIAKVGNVYKWQKA